MPTRIRSLAFVFAVAAGVCGTADDSRGGPRSFTIDEQAPFAIALVGPGMNRTELTAVLGPPSYIQVNGLREAWQYCPGPSLLRFLKDLLRQETLTPLFVTVWFNEGRTEHMRAYPSRVMGSCEDFLAAFNWQDAIEGGGFEAEAGYRIK
ncbi:MAG: hypothetical protein J0H65_04970 [Rhizobiales bacterium]|nr:hypothetical protein [Hyphomicrobiales bacterium]